MRKTFLALILALLLFPVLANDSRYAQVRDLVFWPVLYRDAYETLYCAENKRAGERVTVEHVYAASWLAQANGCPDRRNCPIDAYRYASADLHNLWPALRRYNMSRGNQPFGEIPGESPRFRGDACDYERTSGAGAIVEPRDEVKGDIARSMLYMIHQYNLPARNMLPLLVQWHMQDPPDDNERRRNHEILVLQGIQNPFID